MWHSQIGQDQFVSSTLNGKKNGTFVEIGAGHPINQNNTYTLEKEYRWKGISLEYGPPRVIFWGAGDRPYLNPDDYYYRDGKFIENHVPKEVYESYWNDDRGTPIICGDALSIDYSQLFKDHSLPQTIDYLSLDINPPDTWECLQKMPFSEYTFRVITFEHDFNPHQNPRDKQISKPRRTDSRLFLKNLGYTLIETEGHTPFRRGRGERMGEDWYVYNNS